MQPAVRPPGRPRIDLPAFIRTNLRVAPVPSLPEISLHTAHPASGLWRLADGPEPPPPYWAFQWAGGTALARHILDRPDTVAGRRVLDLGAGSGVVAIAAALSGAAEVIAADIDPNAAAVLPLNAALNHVAMSVISDDLTAGPPRVSLPAVDLVAVGDLFYERGLADRVIGFLDRCLAAGIEVLVGDPGRACLPRARLRLLAEYPVADFGEVGQHPATPSAVFSLLPARS